MKRTSRYAVVGALVVAGAIGAGTVAVAAAGSDDRESPIVGPALEQASRSALAHTRGGRVTDTEAGDEESYYEVEVTLEDGREVDVQLDEAFAVVRGVEADGDDDDRSGDGPGHDD